MSILSLSFRTFNDNNLDLESSPGIIRDKLFLHLDPASSKSYNPGVSTTRWNDISGNGRYLIFDQIGAGTSIASYESDGGGSFLYDGASHYAAIPSGTEFDEVGFLKEYVITSEIDSVVSDGTSTVIATTNTTNQDLRRVVRPGNQYKIFSASPSQFDKDYIITSVEDNGSNLVITMDTVDSSTVTSGTLTSGTQWTWDSGITMEWWMKPQPTGAFMQFLGWRSGDHDFFFLTRGSSSVSNVTSEARMDPRGAAAKDVNPTFLSSWWNTWNHMVFTIHEGTQRVYRNGVALSSTQFWTEGLGVYDNSYLFSVFGRFYAGMTTNSWFFKGYMGTIRVYKRGFSSTDVSTNFNATKTRYGVS